MFTLIIYSHGLLLSTHVHLPEMLTAQSKIIHATFIPCHKLYLSATVMEARVNCQK
jgi:hypothetical protein